MLSRREALLGVLLAPLVKPMAKMLPKEQGLTYTGVDKWNRAYVAYWGSEWREESFDQLLRRRAIEVASKTEERLFLHGDKAVYRG